VKNEAKHILGDIIREYDNIPIELMQQIYSATHAIVPNEQRELQEKLDKQNKINSLTQQLAEKFGDKILYSELKKIVSERIA
jgi:hypothetical protein